MPTVASILETALYVQELGRSVAFYQAIFEFPLILSEKRLAALRVADRNVLLLFKKGASSNPSAAGGNLLAHDADGHMHVAFAIDAADLDQWATRLDQHGIAIESEINWAGGSHSVYFRDPDQHLLELVTPGLWSMSW